MNKPEGVLESNVTKKGRIEHHSPTFDLVSVVFVEIKRPWMARIWTRKAKCWQSVRVCWSFQSIKALNSHRLAFIMPPYKRSQTSEWSTYTNIWLLSQLKFTVTTATQTSSRGNDDTNRPQLYEVMWGIRVLHEQNRFLKHKTTADWELRLSHYSKPSWQVRQLTSSWTIWEKAGSKCNSEIRLVNFSPLKHSPFMQWSTSLTSVTQVRVTAHSISQSFIQF